MFARAPLGLAVGASLLVLACDGADSGPDRAGASPPQDPHLPAACHPVSDDVSFTAMSLALLPTEGGLFAAWLEYPQGQVTASLALAALDDALVSSGTSRIALTGVSLNGVTSPRILLPVGADLLVVSGKVARLVPLASPQDIEAIEVDVASEAAGVALDADRVALLDAEPLHELRYRVLDVRTREVTLELTFADTILGGSLRLLPLADGDLLALWTKPGSTRARATRLRGDGTVVAGPTDVAAALPTKSIALPDALELPGGEIAIAWTGSSGTEVRTKLLPADLDVAADAGVVVNETTEGSQHYARLVRRDGAPEVVWATEEGGISRRALGFASGALIPTGNEVDAVAGCAANPLLGWIGGGVSVASPVDDPMVVWVDQGWEGPDRVLVERVR
jgi:hypothetical protein